MKKILLTTIVLILCSAIAFGQIITGTMAPDEKGLEDLECKKFVWDGTVVDPVGSGSCYDNPDCLDFMKRCVDVRWPSFQDVECNLATYSSPAGVCQHITTLKDEVCDMLYNPPASEIITGKERRVLQLVCNNATGRTCIQGNNITDLPDINGKCLEHRLHILVQLYGKSTWTASDFLLAKNNYVMAIETLGELEKIASKVGKLELVRQLEEVEENLLHNLAIEDAKAKQLEVSCGDTVDVDFENFTAHAEPPTLETYTYVISITGSDAPKETTVRVFGQAECIPSTNSRKTSQETVNGVEICTFQTVGPEGEIIVQAREAISLVISSHVKSECGGEPAHETVVSDPTGLLFELGFTWASDGTFTCIPPIGDNSTGPNAEGCDFTGEITEGSINPTVRAPRVINGDIGPIGEMTKPGGIGLTGGVVTDTGGNGAVAALIAAAIVVLGIFLYALRKKN